MTMKFTHLTTYWDVGDAYTVITFLDELREVLWSTYGEEIIEMQRTASKNNLADDESFDPKCDDETKF